jgi:hypothetical protein
LGSDLTFNSNGPLNQITHTAGTTAITVPNTGIYMISYSVVITNNVDATVSIAVNGTVAVSTSTPTQLLIGEYSDSAILSLNAGDVVTLRIE